MLLPRRCAPLSIPLLTLPLSCTGGGSDDNTAEGESETGDGDGAPCTYPGTAVPDIDPFVAPGSASQPTCSTGWASDVPVEDPEWVTVIANEQSYYYSAPPLVKALSDGAALLIDEQSLQWFDGQGSAGAEVEHGFNVVRSGAVVVRDSDDHVFIAGPGGGDDDLVIREFADGEMVGELPVATPGINSRAIGLFEFSTDEWLIVGDEYDPMEYGNEAFFMHVDALGNEVLRKARPLGYSYYYSPTIAFAALDGDDNLMFGSNSQQWLVDPSTGAVTNPSVGLTAVRDFVGSAVGAGFVSVSAQNNVSTDVAATMVDGFGGTSWTQVYDRAFTNEFVFDVDARPDGGFVLVGRDGIWWDPQQFQSNSQPLLIAFDGQGTAEWLGRLAIPGEARSVDVAADGRVVAAGIAQLGGSNYNDIDAYIWLASW